MKIYKTLRELRSADSEIEAEYRGCLEPELLINLDTALKDLTDGDLFLLETQEEVDTKIPFDVGFMWDVYRKTPSERFIIAIDITSNNGGNIYCFAPEFRGNRYDCVSESTRGLLHEVTRVSPFSGKTNTRKLPLTLEQIGLWQEGQVIQNAMPQLTAEEREFFLSGILEDEWASFFAQMD